MKCVKVKGKEGNKVKDMKKYDLFGFQILEFEELDSTNTKAAELLKGGLEDRSVVLTFRQTKGKGQVGNSWESEAGKNISITVVFRPERLQAVQQFAVSMVIALGCRDFIRKYVQGCCVKWPNDVRTSGTWCTHLVS